MNIVITLPMKADYCASTNKSMWITKNLNVGETAIRHLNMQCKGIDTRKNAAKTNIMRRLLENCLFQDITNAKVQQECNH